MDMEQIRYNILERALDTLQILTGSGLDDPYTMDADSALERVDMARIRITEVLKDNGFLFTEEGASNLDTVIGLVDTLRHIAAYETPLLEELLYRAQQTDDPIEELAILVEESWQEPVENLYYYIEEIEPGSIERLIETLRESVSDTEYNDDFFQHIMKVSLSIAKFIGDDEIPRLQLHRKQDNPTIKEAVRYALLTDETLTGYVKALTAFGDYLVSLPVYQNPTRHLELFMEAIPVELHTPVRDYVTRFVRNYTGT